MVQGYCLKEKKKADIKDPHYELNKKGRPVAWGSCSSCGGKIYKILKATETPDNLKAKVKKGGKAKSPRGSTSKKSRGSRKRTSGKSRKSHSRKH